MNIVITGASRGLGKAMAEKFAEQGHSLYLCAQHDPVMLKTKVDLENRFPLQEVQAKSFDLSSPDQAANFAAWTMETGLQTDPSFSVDVLINNAGKFAPGSIAYEPKGTLEQMISTNLLSAYYVTRGFLPNMMARKKGHIFNICSIASLQAYPQGGSYGISKFALAGFSKNLREELKHHGVKVTAVYPGAVYTDSWAGSGIEPSRIMEVQDIAEMIYASTQLSAQGTVEDIVLRPQGGDV